MTVYLGKWGFDVDGNITYTIDRINQNTPQDMMKLVSLMRNRQNELPYIFNVVGSKLCFDGYNEQCGVMVELPEETREPTQQEKQAWDDKLAYVFYQSIYPRQL